MRQDRRAVYDPKAAPTQKAANIMPASNSIHGRRRLRAINRITVAEMATSPICGQISWDSSMPPSWLIGSCIQADANDARPAMETAKTPPSASPFAHSGTTKSLLFLRQSCQVCATTTAMMISTKRPKCFSQVRPARFRFWRPEGQYYDPQPKSPSASATPASSNGNQEAKAYLQPARMLLGIPLDRNQLDRVFLL